MPSLSKDFREHLREPAEATFHFSIAATFLALVLLGLLRRKVTTRMALRAVGGGSCAVVAYTGGIGRS